MSYNYLLDLYQVLDDRLAQIEHETSSLNMTEAQQSYQRGRRDCLVDFKTHLQQHYHHKLPRRIQKSLDMD